MSTQGDETGKKRREREERREGGLIGGEIQFRRLFLLLSRIPI